MIAVAINVLMDGLTATSHVHSYACSETATKKLAYSCYRKCYC
jgi:hypothetical protein